MIPAAFAARIRTQIDDAEAFLRALEEPAPRSGRVNPARLSRDALAAELGVALSPVPWCTDSFVLPADVTLGSHPLHSAGVFYLQEPSAALPVEVLDPQPGERVLDLCAAPGGKTTQIAAKLGPTGFVVANDVSVKRARALVGNLDRWGAATVVTATTPERLAERGAGGFDRVLVDAPCSGEGLFRRDPRAVAHWSPEHVTGSASRQHEILAVAAELVTAGGVVVYSTCTFAPEENEAVVDAFLGAHPGWSLEPVAPVAGVTVDPVGGTARIWPHRAPGEGQFVARLRAPAEHHGRSRGSMRRDSRAGGGHAAAPPDAIASWREFSARHLDGYEPPGTLVLAGDTLHATSPGLDTAGLPVLRPGLPLGRVRPGRFEPTAALAHALDPVATVPRIELRDDDLAAYVQGNAVPGVEAEGWVVVRTAGCALGWGRARAGALRSLFPKPWRSWVGTR